MQDWTMKKNPKHGWDVLKPYCVPIINYFLARKLRDVIVHYVVCSQIRSDDKNGVQLQQGDKQDMRPGYHRWGKGHSIK